MLREGDVAYVLRVLLRAERADGDALAGAHELHEAQDGVGVLVVAPGSDALGKALPLPLDVVGQQQAAAGVGAQQQLAQEPRGRLQQALPPGQAAVLREGGVKARGLDLAHAADHGLRPQAVEPVHIRGEAV